METRNSAGAFSGVPYSSRKVYTVYGGKDAHRSTCSGDNAGIAHLCVFIFPGSLSRTHRLPFMGELERVILRTRCAFRSTEAIRKSVRSESFGAVYQEIHAYIYFD